ncbi:MAG: D-alanyl-D-alanine carboxypeptidase/D-alanyl-D-alanine endopeptidase [Longimicrobiales bacterium]
MIRRTAAAAGSTVAAAVSFLAACSSAPPPATPAPLDLLAVTLDSVLGSPPLDRTHWGIAVLDQRTGATLHAHNADRHFIPASNTKLVVTAVALGLLGPNWRYETPIYAATRPDSVAQQLVIAARGDPTWSRRFYDSGLAPLDTVAAMVRAAGIRRIEDLVIDATWFDDQPVHPTWEISDLPYSYAPPVDAFAIDEATFRLVVSPGDSPGEPARVMALAPAGQQVIAAIETDTAGARTSINADYMLRADKVFLDGRIAFDEVDTLTLAVTSPAHFAALALRDMFERAGIPVTGAVRVVRDSLEAARLRPVIGDFAAALALQPDAPRAFREIGRVRSPTLDSVVAGILRPSQNWIAEQLLKMLGATYGGEGTWSAGIDVERRFLIDRAAIDSTAFYLRDASGLSVQNLLTPAATVRLLEFVRAQPWAGVYADALPSPGMDESTLENRLEPLADRLRAKTGTITHVNSMAGFLTTVDGRDLTFSIMTNASGVPSAAVRRGIDRIVQALAASRSES